ncbi:type IV pilus modification PilV family protein [Horticoccus sp. 23ND18S-11]|uniref:type IV pilus modification PilV family protein n=1 Tax=Horticoccus sp. 23ND18S-11 TaxID=3391832 RepID=UPI0039C9D27F
MYLSWNHSQSPCKLRHSRGQGGGFSIVEVIMAVSVLAMVLTTSVTTMQRAFLNLDSARNLETACRILQCEIEKERMLTWSQINDVSYVPTLGSSFAGNPAIAGRFSLARSVATVPNHGGNMIQVTVTATWRSYDGRPQDRSYTTYYGKDGLYAYFNSQT